MLRDSAERLDQKQGRQPTSMIRRAMISKMFEYLQTLKSNRSIHLTHKQLLS